MAPGVKSTPNFIPCIWKDTWCLPFWNLSSNLSLSVFSQCGWGGSVGGKEWGADRSGKVDPASGRTCRLKACCRAQDGVTRWRGIAGCRRCRPAVQGSRQGCPTPRRETGPRMGRMGGEQEWVVRVFPCLQEQQLASPVPRYYTRCDMGRGQSKVYWTHGWVWRAEWVTRCAE